MWFQTSAFHPDDGLPPWLNSFPGRCSSRSAKLHPGQPGSALASAAARTAFLDVITGKVRPTKGGVFFRGRSLVVNSSSWPSPGPCSASPVCCCSMNPAEGIQPSVLLDIQRAVNRIIRETGISVLLVEHHASVVRQSDWTYAMQKGGIVASGDTVDLSL